MRVMAIDYGDAHTGVALSDPTGFLTGSTYTIHSRKAQVVLEELIRLIRDHGVDELVMGFPRNMDGTEGPRAQLYRDFARQLEEASGLPVVLWDERRTTVDAHRILFEAGQNAKKRKIRRDDKQEHNLRALPHEARGRRGIPVPGLGHGPAQGGAGRGGLPAVRLLPGGG